MIRSFALLFFMINPGISQAETSSSELSRLKADLMSLVDRVEALEAENKALMQSVVKRASGAESATSSPVPSNWTNSINLNGDFRYRYENIDTERSDTRERNRVRARVAITAKPTNNLELGIGFASGSDDPVSTNQTLGRGGTTKDINLDLAYFKWQAKPGLHVTGGKTKNIFHRPSGNGLLWDGDYRPEGFGLKYKPNHFFLRAAASFLESDSKGDNNKTIYGLQSGWEGPVGSSNLLAGISYYEIDTKTEGVFTDDPDDFYGNTFDCPNDNVATTCVYRNDFEELQIFAQLETLVGKTPFTLFVDLVQNQAADDLDTAWAVGLTLGKANRPNSWEIGYTYQNIEADALLGLVTDSDFAGGGTDSKGHILKGAWAVNKKWKIGITYFDNVRNMDIGVQEDYERVILDTAFKF